MSLKKLGLKRNWIYEGIVSTYSEKIPNAAPMGFRTNDFKHIAMNLYKRTQTYKNIIKNKCFVLNLVKDINLFYIFSAKKRSAKFIKSKMISAPILKNSEGYMEVKVKNVINEGNKAKIVGIPLSYVGVKNPPFINRAEGICLECIIKFTKIGFVGKRKAQELLKQIYTNHDIIHKVAPNSRYEKIVKKIISECKKFS